MVHLSRKYLNENKLSKIYQLFFLLISASGNKENFLLIIKDFISPPEQIMIAKRIAMIYLLTKGLPKTEIAEFLSVSSSTVAKFALLFYKKETKSIVILRNLITTGKIKGFIEDLFADLFIQPGLQKGHWALKIAHEKRKYDRKNIEL